MYSTVIGEHGSVVSREFMGVVRRISRCCTFVGSMSVKGLGQWIRKDYTSFQLFCIRMQYAAFGRPQKQNISVHLLQSLCAVSSYFICGFS